MSNLSAAFEGASQGLGQMAGMAMQHEMAEAMAVRAENLAILRNQLSTRRELLVTGARGQVLNAVSNNRVAAEHTARDEEIDRQEGGRARNQSAAQHQQLINTEHAQDNAFVNQGELQGRTARVQASRDAMLQAQQARADKAQIRTWLANYSAKHPAPGSLADNPVPLDTQGLAQLAQHDPVLKSQLQAYKDASDREQAATRTMGKFPSSYDTPSTPGAVVRRTIRSQARRHRC
jgi:hypothetical protein